MAANQMQRSVSVASGSWRKQAVNCAWATAFRNGAGPLCCGKAATEPLVRWRRRNLRTNESDTLNCAANSPIVRPPCWQAAATRSRKSME
jgi:hypothetical protein